MEQVHLFMADEAQRNIEAVEDIRSQMTMLTNVTEKNDKKLGDLFESMEFFKRYWKRKEHEKLEAGSSTRTVKQTQARSTGYPPGFIPTTPPTHTGVQNDIPPWEEPKTHPLRYGCPGDNVSPVDLQFQMQQMGLLDNSQVRPHMT